MKLNRVLKKRFRSVLDSYHRSLWRSPLSGELDFIDRTVSSFHKRRISVAKQSLTARSKRIHLTPKVKFSRSGFPMSQAITKELADLLVTYKYFVNGVLQAHRAILIQSKYTGKKNRSWKIDTDQFYFMTQWPKFKIVSPARFTKPYSVKPKTLTWSTYGFVGPNAVRYPVYYSSTRMLRARSSIPSSKTFSFTLQSPIGWDSSTSFLLKFVQGFVGENLLSSLTVKKLVHALYVIAGWKLDPPGELEWNNEESEEKEGFGVVEFTVRAEEG